MRSPLARRILALAVFVLAANVAAWIWALLVLSRHPVLLGTALIAYSFGLRHAVDADHIAAIDNVTRKLMQAGQRPAATGFWFALGHSTIVFVATIAIAATATSFRGPLQALHGIGATLGTLVSALLLLAIAGMNLAILNGAYRRFRRAESGMADGDTADGDFAPLAGGGLLARLFRPLFGLIRASWQMYPVGVLFGLGFDTATEIGLLGLSAAEAQQGLPIWSILVFPALFAAGMMLIDTADGVLMLGAYGWAFVKPIRKAYYDLTLTFVSVLVALLVGGIEILGVIQDQFQLAGAFWDEVGALNDNFGAIGCVIIGVFALSWLAAAAIYRWRRYDRPELASGN
jgi:nickel/cobalt transporter (NiCoT) family protein